MKNSLPVAPPHVYLMINEVVFKSNNWGGVSGFGFGWGRAGGFSSVCNSAVE